MLREQTMKNNFFFYLINLIYLYLMKYKFKHFYSNFIIN